MTNTTTAAQNHFSKLRKQVCDDGFMTLDMPTETTRGKMMSRFRFDTDNEKLMIQLPKCSTKAGIMKNAGSSYVDLVFANDNETVDELMALILDMETECAKKIHANSQDWFAQGDDESSFTLQQFEDMFVSLIRLNKRQGTISIRANVITEQKVQKNGEQLNKCDVYNMGSVSRPLNALTDSVTIIPLIELYGVSIASTSINLVLHLSECMIVSGDEAIIKEKSRRKIVVPSAEPIAPIADDVIVKPKDAEETEKSARKSLESVETQEEAAHESPAVTQSDEQTEPMEVALEELAMDEEEVISSLKVENEPSTEGDKPDQTGIDANADEVEDATENIAEGTGGQPAPMELEVVENLPLTQEATDNDGLCEIVDLPLTCDEKVSLRAPNEVYKEIYRTALAKAKKLRQVALDAYLDAKRIKARFMLDEFEESDMSDMEDEEEVNY